MYGSGNALVHGMVCFAYASGLERAAKSVGVSLLGLERGRMVLLVNAPRFDDRPGFGEVGKQVFIEGNRG